LQEVQPAFIFETHQEALDVRRLSLQFQDVTRQQVEQIVTTMTDVDRHNESLEHFLLGELAPESVPRIGPLLERMYGTYVMDGQRENHDRSVNAGRAQAATGPPIELF
jgi:methyl-accepting chemotaxis protein